MIKPRVLLADDNIGVATALRRLLEPDVELVGVVHDGGALVQAVRELKPDVVVTDLSMPLMTGLEALRKIKRDGAAARVILLTVFEDSHLATEALREGASAWLSKYAAGEELVDTIYRAFAEGAMQDKGMKTPRSRASRSP